MSITIKRAEDFESYANGGQFNYAGKGLGLTAWGMNLLKLPPHWKDYPDHDHSTDGQEEVYYIIEGSVTLKADGQSYELNPGTFVHAPAHQKRQFIPGDNGVTMLAMGGIPGKPWPAKK